MRLGLKLVAANGSQAVAVPAGRTLVVGRSPACDVPIRDLTVSRHHGEIEAAAGGLRIRDLGSTNGTFVNGARISEGVAAPGSRVAFGKVTFQVMEERAAASSAGGESEAQGPRLTIVSQMRAQSSTDIASLLTDEPSAADGSRLRVRGDTPPERRRAALALLLEIAKELSQQGEPVRLLDKTARLVLQALRVDRVDILTLGDADEMMPRVRKVRPGSSGGEGQVPRSAARKAVIDRVAVLIAATVPGDDTDSMPRLGAELPASHQSGPLATTDAVRMSSASRGTGSGTSGAVVVAASSPRSELARGSAICAPLLGMQATVLGLLYVASAEPDALGREELEFLTAFAGVLAVSLENLSLVDRARGEAVAQAGYQRHFGPVVAEQVAGQDGGAGLRASRRRVVYLCCEIRGFTALAEELEVEEVAHLLSEFFGEMTELVFEHGGTLDTRIGAGLTALWGAPLSRQEDADEAVQAAVGMQRGLERLNGEWSRQGRRQLEISIGIDLGPVFAGNVGSDQRLDFTVVGPPVERSSRLCANAAGGEILVSEALVESLSNPPPVEAVPASPSLQMARPVYRVDWRTPPTLRQSGEMSQV